MDKKGLINIKISNKIDAYFIRNLRINRGDSGEKLANVLNISKTYLYSIENGNINPSDEFMQNVLTYYKIIYNQSVDLYADAYNLTIKTYECIILKKNELLAKYEVEFNEKRKIFKYSKGFIFIELIQAIINIIKNKDFSVSMLERASRYLSLYDNNIAYIYGVIYGFGKGIGYNLTDTKSVIYDIYDSYPNHDILPIIKGMFYYQLGRINREEQLYLDALKYYHESIEMLKTIYCVERINQVNIEIANILLSLHLYDEAEKKYLELLAEAKKYNFKRRICACLNNLSYLYLIQNRYEECENCVIAAKKAGSNHYDLNYYLAYCAYKTRKKDNARSIISKLVNNEEDRYATRMMKLIQGFVNDNEGKIDNYFEILKKELFNLDDKLEIDLLYEMVISYYVKKNTDKCAKLVEEYVNIVKN